MAPAWRQVKSHMKASMDLKPGETIIFNNRPAWRSLWVFMLGFFLVAVGPSLSDNPPLSPQVGAVFGVIFALLILKRWSDVYTLTNKRLLTRGGLIYRETYEIDLADMTSVTVNQGINLRLVGAGHILIQSRRPEQETIILYGQLEPKQLAARMERLIEDQRKEL
jgi:uncharacterized membrane protein YdbT with pleckstrin-like domain